MVLKILPARVSFIPNLVALRANLNRKSSFDAFTGMGATVQLWNDFAAFARINLTAVEATEAGSCIRNGSEVHCTGIRGQLYRNESDFTFWEENTFAFDDPTTASLGPVTGEREVMFLSLPQVESYQAKVIVSDIFKQLPITIYLFVVSIYFLSSLLINWSVIRRKFKSKIGLLSLFAVTMMMPYTDFNKARKRFAYLACLLNAYFFYILLSSNITSDSVTVVPAKYAETLEDVYLFNRIPVLYKSSHNHRYMMNSMNPTYRELAKRGIILKADHNARTYQTLTSLITNKTKAVNIVPGRLVARHSATCICLFTGYNGSIMRRIHFSKPFFKVVTVSLFRKGIWTDNVKLATRLHHKFTSSLEAGIRKHHFDKDLMEQAGAPDFILDPLRKCLSQLSQAEDNDPTFDPFSMSKFGNFYNLIAMLMLSYSVILLIEVVRSNWTVWKKGMSTIIRKIVSLISRFIHLLYSLIVQLFLLLVSFCNRVGTSFKKH